MRRLLRALFFGTSRLPYGSAARGVDPSAVRPDQRAEPTTLIHRPDDEK
ncbi:hypothetical protein ACLM5J_08575 [Nocardioides sp. Bht2]